MHWKFCILSFFITFSWIQGCNVVEGDTISISVAFERDRMVTQTVDLSFGDTLVVDFYNANRQVWHFTRRSVEIRSSDETNHFDLAFYRADQTTPPFISRFDVFGFEEKLKPEEGLIARVDYPSNQQLNRSNPDQNIRLKITTYPWLESSTISSWQVSLGAMTIVLASCILLFCCVSLCMRRERCYDCFSSKL